MGKALKTLLKTGIYSAPQGILRATPARLRRWAEQFRAMKSEGIRVPIGWGHHPTAVPGDADQRAEQQFYLSKMNAGTLSSLDFDGNADLNGALDCPGVEVDGKGNLVAWTKLPDGREVKTAISEVSIAVKDWRDGKGKLWKDSIVHVALTPLPVFAGQDGFATALSTVSTDPSEFTLSLAGFSRALSTEDDMNNDALITELADAIRGTVSSINQALLEKCYAVF